MFPPLGLPHSPPDAHSGLSCLPARSQATRKDRVGSQRLQSVLGVTPNRNHDGRTTRGCTAILQVRRTRCRISSCPRARYGEAFWRAHHEAWRRSELNPAGVLRSSGDFAQSVPQLAGEFQSRTPTHGAQAAVPPREPKSHPLVTVSLHPTRRLPSRARNGCQRSNFFVGHSQLDCLAPSCHDVAPRSIKHERGIHERVTGSMAACFMESVV